MDLRREQRYSICVAGRYRSGTGRRYDVAIANLSEYGCHFEDFGGRGAPGDTISLRIGEIGPIMARVKWMKQLKVGVEFDAPLHPSVLDHIVAAGGIDQLRQQA